MERTTHIARLVRAAAAASVAVSITIGLIKLAAAIATGSVAILASLVDSLTDTLASAITWMSVRIGQQPPDRQHRFGHGKAEALSALAQAVLVAGAALFVIAEAARRLLAPQPVSATAAGMAAMLAAILLTLALLAFQRRVVRLSGSQAIAADSLHYRSDLLTNLAILAGLLAAERLGWLWLDPLLGVGVALYLLAAVAGVGRRAIDELMDVELPRREREAIRGIVLARPDVAGLHDLRTRRSGRTVFIEMHLELDPEMTVRAAHAITEEIERALRARYPEAEIAIHQEPAGLIEERRLDRIVRGLAQPSSDA